MPSASPGPAGSSTRTARVAPRTSKPTTRSATLAVPAYSASTNSSMYENSSLVAARQHPQPPRVVQLGPAIDPLLRLLAESLHGGVHVGLGAGPPTRRPPPGIRELGDFSLVGKLRGKPGARNRHRSVAVPVGEQDQVAAAGRKHHSTVRRGRPESGAPRFGVVAPVVAMRIGDGESSLPRHLARSNVDLRLPNVQRDAHLHVVALQRGAQGSIRVEQGGQGRLGHALAGNPECGDSVQALVRHCHRLLRPAHDGADAGEFSGAFSFAAPGRGRPSLPGHAMDLDEVRIHYARDGLADKRDVAVSAGRDRGLAHRLGQEQTFLDGRVSASRGQCGSREGRAGATRAKPACRVGRRRHVRTSHCRTRVQEFGDAAPGSLDTVSHFSFPICVLLRFAVDWNAARMPPM